jgi:hypothetical protein
VHDELEAAVEQAFVVRGQRLQRARRQRALRLLTDARAQ